MKTYFPKQKFQTVTLGDLLDVMHAQDEDPIIEVLGNKEAAFLSSVFYLIRPGGKLSIAVVFKTHNDVRHVVELSKSSVLKAAWSL